LLLADVVSGLVLGRSVLGMANSGAAGGEGDAKSGGRDWKEKLADQLLGQSAEPAAASSGQAAPPPAPAATPGVAAAPAAPHPRVAALLARVKAAQPVPDLRFEEVLDVINACYTCVAAPRARSAAGAAGGGVAHAPRYPSAQVHAHRFSRGRGQRGGERQQGWRK
jgi:hypothetical protein